MLTAHAEWAGKRVVDVLRELRSQGLNFIYSSSVLDNELRVTGEPKSQGGVELAREVLAQHGLELRAVAAQTFAVVSARDSVDNPSAIEMALSTGTLDAVIVTSRYSLASSDAGAAVLTQDQVNRQPRLGDETLRAVQRLPGAAANGFSSLSAMRGGVPNETGIILDGMRLYEPFHLKNFLSPISVLDARIVASMDVYSGGFPAQFGDRISAVVDAHTVQPTDASRPRYYELGLSVFHLSGLAGATFADGNASALVAVRRSNLSELSQLAENDFGKPAYSDGFARITYQWNEATEIAVNALLARDEILALKDGGRQQADAEYRNDYVWAWLVHRWSDRAQTRVQAAFTDVTNSRTGLADYPGQRSGVISDRRTFHIASLKLDGSWQSSVVSPRWTHNYGLEARELSAEYDYGSSVRYEQDYPFPGSPAMQTTRSLAPRPDGDELAAYWSTRARWSDAWATQVGLRFDRQTEFSKQHTTHLSPRLSVLYSPTPQWRLRASWGEFVQAQGINELQVEDGVTDFMSPQQAQHWVLGVERGFDAGYVLRAEAYRKDYRRLMPRYENLFATLSLLPEVEFDRVGIAPSSARADGVELTAQANGNPTWQGWFTYSWSRVRDRIDGVDVPRAWDQTHAVSAGLMWSHYPWQATLVDQYHSGWPTTEVTVDSASGGTQAIIGPRNARRLRAYNSLDLRFSRTFELRRGQLDVFIEVANLTARNNDCCAEYTVESVNGSTLVNREMSYWLGITPSAGLLWRY